MLLVAGPRRASVPHSGSTAGSTRPRRALRDSTDLAIARAVASDDAVEEEQRRHMSGEQIDQASLQEQLEYDQHAVAVALEQIEREKSDDDTRKKKFQDAAGELSYAAECSRPMRGSDVYNRRAEWNKGFFANVVTGFAGKLGKYHADRRDEALQKITDPGDRKVFETAYNGPKGCWRLAIENAAVDDKPARAGHLYFRTVPETAGGGTDLGGRRVRRQRVLWGAIPVSGGQARVLPDELRKCWYARAVQAGTRRLLRRLHGGAGQGGFGHGDV